MANTVEIQFIGKGDLIDQIKALDRATKSLINTQAKLTTEGKKVKDKIQSYLPRIDKRKNNDN